MRFPAENHLIEVRAGGCSYSQLSLGRFGSAQRNGWPIAKKYLDQGGDGVLVIPNTAAMINGGPNREAAKELTD